MSITHQMSSSTTYNSWRGMIERCSNRGNTHYHAYGGRGIKVCERWRSFDYFLMDMGERPKNHSLDRINNDKDYEPTNCKWSTAADQSRNRTDNVWIEWEGRRQILADWASELNLTSTALAVRIERWGLAKALTTKKLKNGNQRLTDEQVLYARKVRAEKGYRYGGVHLAKQYGVSLAALGHAVQNETFTHLPSWQSMKRVDNEQVG